MSLRHVMAALVLLLVGAGAGLWFGAAPQNSAAAEGDGPCAGGAQPVHWAAPMDPSYQRKAPGKSPMGMDLVPVCAEGGSGGGVDVRIDAHVVNNLGLRTGVVARGALPRDIAAVGVVSYDENSFQMIHARAEGWLENLAVESEGARVERDQALYALFSPKLVAAEQEYLSAGRSQRPALVAAAAERLLALGYSREQIAALERRGTPDKHLLRRAQSDAVVSMLGVRDGQFVSPGTHMMTLASLNTVWVLVDVMERDAAHLRPGLEASAQVDAWPGRRWQGRVEHVYPSLDALTRTLRVRLVFDNSDGALRPNMFAHATIHAAPLADVLSVPAAAVIRSGQGQRVVRRIEAGGFDVVPVRTGVQAGDRVQVLDGLQAGDEVVVSGQFLIDSEANLDAEALRLKAAHPQGRTRAVINALDSAARRITLRHEAIQPMGEQGLSMPGMTMPFELAVDADGFEPGDRVEVVVRQPGPGRFEVVQLDALADQPHAGHDHAAMHGNAAPAERGELTRGRVVSIEPQRRRVTLQHEAIESVGMAAMTMPFAWAPALPIPDLEPGDEVRFSIDPETMQIDRLELAP